MKIEIMTLFPDMCARMFSESIIGRGIENGLVTIRCHQIRDWTTNKQCQVDDYPYGGGGGMVMQADPLFRCHEHICAEFGGGEHIHTIFMSPCGSRFDQGHARRLLTKKHIILVCCHYEGVDQRFIDECVDEEISLGDFVLTGGEIAACAIADAICRMVPGVLADSSSFENESHWAGLLEYPQYSRPLRWHDREVPEILLSGHHANIEKWRREMSIARTAERRPDMLASAELTDKERADLIARGILKSDKE